jgi:uncharacterized protein YbbK (DUF523 family)
MKNFILVSVFIAAACASEMVPREAQPAAAYEGISEEVKAAILAPRSARAGIELARQYNCDGACILANSPYCDSAACTNGIDANWYVPGEGIHTPR